MSKVHTQSDKTHNTSLLRSVNIQNAFPEITNTQLEKFKDFFSLQNIVLLGDPGAGKTHTFQEAAKHENAKFLSVRVFLATKGKNCKNKVIYLDGLDEFRSRMDDKNVILEVIQLLSDIGCRGLRLSCRAQDWLGDSDLSLFEGYFGEERYVVLNLESLREDEIITILKNQGIDNPEKFIRKAALLNISTLLHNPQTLVMLIDVVKQKGGEWPATKKDLYQKSTKLLLTEHNDERSRSGIGQYTSDELQGCAGIACACILISGVEGISLRNNGSNPTFPSYREITLCDSNLLQASLNRRVFSHSSDETVTCVHRTVAEFLAASWLTDQVTNNNLPIKRVLSLIASEEHPTADLRGLYAWLATLLPDNYNCLFDNDPYGVLMYGDSASLSPASRQYLLASIETLKEKDPWFRSSDWSDNPLGALAGKDMELAFKRILTDSESGFHLRNIVLNAITQGKPNRNLIPELQSVLVTKNYNYSDRSDAIEALLGIGKKGEECIVDCYHRKIIKEPKTIRLRINILRHLYREYFTSADAVQTIVDHATQNKGESNRIYGLLYDYSNLFFISDTPEILNAICLKIPDRSNYEKQWHNKSEIEICLSEMIERVLQSPLNVTPENLYNWLSSLYRLNYSLNNIPKELCEWLKKNQSFVFEMFDYAYETSGDKTVWSIYNELITATFHTIDQQDFALHLLEEYLSNPEKHLQIYEIYARITFHNIEPSQVLLDNFYRITDESNPQILEIKKAISKCELEDCEFDSIQRNISYKKKELQRKQFNQQAIKKTLELIETGKHYGNLEWLAENYFYHQNGKTGGEKLADVVGENMVPKILKGFQVILESTDLPSADEIAELDAKKRYFPWWIVLLAGMDEHWLSNPSFEGFSQQKLSTLLSVSIVVNTGDNDRIWHKEIVKQFPELAERVYEAFTFKSLKQKKETISVIYDLFENDFLPPWKEQFILRLLSKFPSISEHYLESLLQVLLANKKYHAPLLQLTKEVINKRGQVKKESRLSWLMVGFVLDENYFSSILVKYVKSRSWCAGKIATFFEERRNPDYGLSISQISILARIIGHHVPLTDHSSPFDTNGFVRDLITKLSIFHNIDAGKALQELLHDKELVTYKNHIKHAIAEQALIHRTAIYQQPNWLSVIESLRNRHPANIADLHALTLDHLHSLKTEILNTNTDKYKAFWNTDSYGKITEPLVEDICRDRLIDLLRPNYVNMNVEPEGHMAQDKRADIIIQTPSLKLPLELKRDIHPDLWTACENQLERMYTRDPDAGGYGIYVVFWFGSKRKGKIKHPPQGLVMPKTAQKLEDSLLSFIPEEKRHCLSVVVLDICPT